MGAQAKRTLYAAIGIPGNSLARSWRVYPTHPLRSFGDEKFREFVRRWIDGTKNAVEISIVLQTMKTVLQFFGERLSTHGGGRLNHGDMFMIDSPRGDLQYFFRVEEHV